MEPPLQVTYLGALHYLDIPLLVLFNDTSVYLISKFGSEFTLPGVYHGRCLLSL